MIREENQRMLSQVENVLMISKLEKSSISIDLYPIDFHDAVEDAVRHLDLIAKNQKGKIITHLKATQTQIEGNMNHFTSVIVNMLDNSIKYSDEAPVITLHTFNVGKSIKLKIIDEGIGMDMKTQKHIFDKFFREQGGNIHNVKGHGLGLSYVKKIVEFHRGHIELKSKVGEGTTITISIPLL
jgi:signal transduction histidine kinase